MDDGVAAPLLYTSSAEVSLLRARALERRRNIRPKVIRLRYAIKAANEVSNHLPTAPEADCALPRRQLRR
jgi:hypothetical protein